MRRRALLVPALALAVGTLACGGGSQQSEAPASSGAAAPAANPVDPATAASVTGRIALDGAAPKAELLKMSSDPTCMREGQGATTEFVVVGENNALQNVFVYVKDGLGNRVFPAPSTAAVLDQRGCRYVPRVVGVQVGQPLKVLNSDPTLHNVHAIPNNNQEFNTGQPIKGMEYTHTFSTKEVMVPFKCDVHGWMNAYVGVVDHPYYAVTAGDGSFELKNLPPGTYTIEAWHEKLGTQTQTVTVGEKETKDVAFTFKVAT